MTYTRQLPDDRKSTTRVWLKCDCENCHRNGEEYDRNWREANKNYQDNDGKHQCRECFMASDKNPAKNPENMKKAAETNLKRHGGMVMNSKENIAKRSEKFKDAEWVAKRTAKTKETDLKTYGVPSHTQAPEVKAKKDETMMRKYGVLNPLQNADIREKTRQTNQEKYGVDNPAQLPEVQAKMAATMMERYGVEYYNQLPEMREKCAEWLKESREEKEIK